MEKNTWTSTDVRKLFRLHERFKSPQTLLNAEERGEIPHAARIARGKTSVRQWPLRDLPTIGRRLGFLRAPKQQEVVCVYTAKGGVLKTTASYILGRLLALNGIRTIIVGLDIQCSITDITLPLESCESLEDAPSNPRVGLYEMFAEGRRVADITVNTGLPTLDIIPENPNLNALEKKLRNETRREYAFVDSLLPQLSAYEVVIFDNGPSWNQLIENALTAATTVLSPAGCDLGTYQALKTNLTNVRDFQQQMKLEWRNFFIMPTLLEKTKLSQQIYGAYLNQYGEHVLPSPIRRAIKGQEALLLRQSPLEHSPTSPLATDYFEAIKCLWERVLDAQNNEQAA